MPQVFADKDWLKRDRLPQGVSEYNLSIHITKITRQPSKYKPVSMKPVEIEAVRLKRAKVFTSVKEDSKQAQVLAVIEFRGRGLTFTVTKGECNVGQMAWRLSKYHHSRYGKAGLRIISAPNSQGLCDCTLENPGQFLDFLHLIQNKGCLAIRVWQEQSKEHFGGIRQVESFKLGSDEAQVSTPATPSPPRTVPTQRERLETIAQLGDKVYGVIMKELVLWDDPIRASSSEWARLQLAERRLVMKVPENIARLLNEASGLFEKKYDFQQMLREYVDEATISYISELGLAKREDLGTVEFRLIGQPGGNGTIYISWIWEHETDVNNYVWDFFESKYPRKTEWRLETWVYSPKGGVGALIAGDSETRRIINHVLRLLMSKQFARELQSYNKKIRDLGRRIAPLIDEELKKG